MRDRFRTAVVPALMKERGYGNPFQVPRLEKVVINMGVGEGKENPKVLDFATADLQAITGQKPVITRAKKSIANFKLRENVPIGCKVTPWRLPSVARGWRAPVTPAGQSRPAGAPWSISISPSAARTPRGSDIAWSSMWRR